MSNQIEHTSQHQLTPEQRLPRYWIRAGLVSLLLPLLAMGAFTVMNHTLAPDRLNPGTTYPDSPYCESCDQGGLQSMVLFTLPAAFYEAQSLIRVAHDLFNAGVAMLVLAVVVVMISSLRYPAVPAAEPSAEVVAIVTALWFLMIASVVTYGMAYVAYYY